MSMVILIHVYECLKMGELVAVQALEYVEDEITLLTVSFTKSNLQNILSEHLVICIE